ncbi:hypothetical protein T265_13392, partial [Opisthorchis viverrini]
TSFANPSVRIGTFIPTKFWTVSRLGHPGSIPALVLPSGGMAARHRNDVTAERLLFKLGARWPKWLEHEFTDRKVRGSNPTSASRLPLSRLGIPALVSPKRGMAVWRRKGATTERFFLSVVNPKVRTKKYQSHTSKYAIH